MGTGSVRQEDTAVVCAGHTRMQRTENSAGRWTVEMWLSPMLRDAHPERGRGGSDHADDELQHRLPWDREHALGRNANDRIVREGRGNRAGSGGGERV